MLSYADFMNENYPYEEETHEDTLTTKGGLNIKVKATKFPQVNNCIAVQAFMDGHEHDIAHAQFRKNEDDTYYSMNAVTNNDLQKQGIMTALYNFVEEKFGIKIVPSTHQEPGGKEFWKKRYIKEHKYSHLRKENPLFMGKAESSSPIPIEGCCSLIISKPYPDGLKRVFMGVIDKVIGDRKVVFIPQYFIIKEYPNGKIWYEKVDLTELNRKKYLNMSTNALLLNQNKTPLWEKSSQLNKEMFFNQFQDEIKQLLHRKDIFIIKSQNNTPK